MESTVPRSRSRLSAGVLLAMLVALCLLTGDRRPAEAQPAGIGFQVSGLQVNANGPYRGVTGQPVIFRATVRAPEPAVITIFPPPPPPPPVSYQFRWSFGDGTTGTGQVVSHVFATPGTYTVTVTAFGGGLSATSQTFAVIQPSVQPLVVNAGGPYTAQAGTPVQFRGAVGGLNPGVTVQFQWSFGDGTTGAGPTPSNVYNQPGTYTVTLQAFASTGQRGSATTTVQVAPRPQPPVAGPGGPYTGIAGSTITFVATPSNLAAPHYQWRFGDNNVASGQVVTNVYASPGVYTVTLVVTDLQTRQSSTATTTATISAPPTPPPAAPMPAPIGPPAREYASMAYHPPSGRLVLFGGVSCRGDACADRNDTWTWDGQTWTQQSPGATPPTRSSAALAFHEPSGRLVLFGGIDCDGETCTDLDDTWTWDGETWRRESPLVRPRERSDAAMVYDAARGVVVLFGGQDTGRALLGDTWTWDGQTWTPRQTPQAPTPRFGAGIAYDAARRVVVLFGGDADTLTDLGDTWTWDGQTWTQQAGAGGPPPRSFAAMEFDPARNLTVLFGGARFDDTPLGDTWVWDGSRWQQRSPGTSPAPRYAAGFGAFPPRGQMVLVGGTNGAGDTWLWDGSTWSRPR